jgi:hypothetical protein
VSDSFVVGVQLASSIVKAISFRISPKGDVYANYSMDGIPEAHASYHASGQQHIKKGRKYSPQGKRFKMPPTEVVTRVLCQEDSIAWKVAKLGNVLPVLNEAADMIVDARGLSDESLLLFKAWVIGNWVREHRPRPGFRKIKADRFGTNVRVEIEAYEVSPDAPTIVSISDF